MKLWSFYTNLKIKDKLFVLLLVEALILSIVSITALQISFYIYDEQIYKQAIEVLNFSSINVENKLKQVSQLSFNIISNKELQEYLIGMKSAPSLYNRFRAQDKLVEKIWAWSLTLRYIDSIQVIDTEGIRHVGGIDSLKISNEHLRDIMEKANAAKGKDLWVEPYKEGKAIVSTRIIRTIPKLSLDPLGTLMISIDPAKLIDRSSNLHSRYNPNIVILHGSNIIFEGFKLFPFNTIKLPKNRDQGYIITKVNGEKYLVAYTTSDYTNWTYLNIIPYRTIFKQTFNVRIIMMVLYFCVFIVIQYLGVKFARDITKPFERLTEEMKKVEKGNFENIQYSDISSDKPRNEVESLEYDFRLMVDKINTLIRENYTKQIMVKESELKALHAQINPHFLYNTLDSIHWLAKLNKQPGIAMMVKSLGNLLRNSISKQNYVMTIGEEVKLLEDYIAIQKIRYEERLDFTMTIDEDVKDCMIAKLTLQPIVENSINYGLEQLPGICRINVETVLHPDIIEIRIEDNGPGIEEDFLSKLRNNEIQPEGSGIGLKNIDERIRMIFGEEHGLCIDSTIGKGTVVSICLPYVRRRKHV